MPPLAALLLILASGWILYRLWLVTRYRALKDSGHPQYFGAVVASAYVLLISVSLREALATHFGASYTLLESSFSTLFPAPLTEKANTYNKDSFSSLIAITAWSLFVVYPLCVVLNIPLKKSSLLLKAVFKKAGGYDPLEAITAHVLDRGLSLAVTMGSGKVYIGIPIKSSQLDEEKKWISIFLLVSGARKTDGTLDITTKYNETYKEILESNKHPSINPQHLLQDFQVILPTSEAVSIQTFDLEKYVFFQGKKPGQSALERPTKKEGMSGSIGGHADDRYSSGANLIDIDSNESYYLRMYYAYVIFISLAIVSLPLIYWGFSMLIALVGWVIPPQVSGTQKWNFLVP